MEESTQKILTDETEALRARVAELQAELAERDRCAEERAEFRTLYPDIDPDTLPDGIRTDGARSLSAAYALYERQKAVLAAYAERVNESNAEKASGVVHHDGGKDGFFTLDEVRRMTPAEIRQNYRTVLSSLGRQTKKY